MKTYIVEVKVEAENRSDAVMLVFHYSQGELVNVREEETEDGEDGA